jgi:RAD50-interacting protein 1
MNITAEFEAPLQTLDRDMSFLHNALATAAFRRIFGEILDFLEECLWHDVLMREKFTRNGAAQFHRDLSATWSLVDTYITDGSASSTRMPKLREAIVLLNLPDKAQEGLMSFSDAYDRAFASNAQAAEVMEELNFKSLTYIEVRQVLGRRQE